LVRFRVRVTVRVRVRINAAFKILGVRFRVSRIGVSRVRVRGTFCPNLLQ
jgi:hypothetical protein